MSLFCLMGFHQLCGDQDSILWLTESLSYFGERHGDEARKVLILNGH